MCIILLSYLVVVVLQSAIHPAIQKLFFIVMQTYYYSNTHIYTKIIIFEKHIHIHTYARTHARTHVRTYLYIFLKRAPHFRSGLGAAELTEAGGLTPPPPPPHPP